MKQKKTRPPIERLEWIDSQIREGRYPNASSIAEHFEMSRKTIQNDLDFMRDRLKHPMEYSAKHRGWCYTAPVLPLNRIPLTEGEIVLILMAERLARQYGGTVGRQIERALVKVAGALTDTVTVDLAQLAAAHSFEALPTTEIRPEFVSRLETAIRTRRRIEMTYFTASKGTTSTRRADPLHIRNAKGEWYVLAFDPNKGKVLDFHIGRIRELALLDETFAPPADFNLEEVLGAGFQMFRGAGTPNTEVVVEFDEYQSRWIRGQTKVHDEAIYEDLPDGGLRVTMKVGSWEGVKLWAMQYGSHAKVVAPEALRAAVREEVARMAEYYAPPKR